MEQNTPPTPSSLLRRIPTIEQGVIPVFRLFLWLRLGLTLLLMCGWLADPEQRAQRFPIPALLEVSFLLVYLSLPGLERALKQVYLPMALLIASTGPIVEYAINIWVRMQSGLPVESINDDRWVLFLALMVPLLIVSWQYRIGVLLGFIGATGLLELLLAAVLRLAGGPPVVDAMWLVLIRSIMFALIGYILVRLMEGQRQQRHALAEANAQLEQANRQLSTFAATLEQLAISQERNRLAREMHDTLAHSLSAVAVQLEAVKSLWESDPENARAMLDRSLIATRHGLQEARRAIHDLRASPLDDLGLGLAVRQGAEAVAERLNLELQCDVPQHLDGLPPAVEQGVYRIADEALSNVARHATSAETLRVVLHHYNGSLDLLVEDDGPGFDPNRTLPSGHFGLKGLHERALMIGGTVTITSTPGEGTRVQLIIPEIPTKEALP